MKAGNHVLPLVPFLAAFAASVAVAQCPNVRPNGYCPETTLRPGESPIWQLQFKGIRDAGRFFEESYDFEALIDSYNNWVIEFDLYSLFGSRRVSRYLCEYGGNALHFSTALQRISLSQRTQDKVTFLVLTPQSGGTFPYECFSNLAGVSNNDGFREIKEDLFQQLPEEQFYTHADFRDIDNFTWPSVQELVRRGQHYVVFLGEFFENDDGPAGVEENFFFGVFDENPDWGNPGNCALAQRDGGCDAGGTPSAWTPNSRFLMRGYPSGACAGSCSLQNDGYFSDGLSQGYNFISTDCVEDDVCVRPPVHSPIPMIVKNSATTEHQWGTADFPLVGSPGLFAALNFVSPMVEIRVSNGDYNVRQFLPFPSAPMVINRPMVINKQFGPGEVVIR